MGLCGYYRLAGVPSTAKEPEPAKKGKKKVSKEGKKAAEGESVSLNKIDNYYMSTPGKIYIMIYLNMT